MLKAKKTDQWLKVLLWTGARSRFSKHYVSVVTILRFITRFYLLRRVLSSEFWGNPRVEWVQARRVPRVSARRRWDALGSFGEHDAGDQIFHMGAFHLGKHRQNASFARQ